MFRNLTDQTGGEKTLTAYNNKKHQALERSTRGPPVAKLTIRQSDAAYCFPVAHKINNVQ